MPVRGCLDPAAGIDRPTYIRSGTIACIRVALYPDLPNCSLRHGHAIPLRSPLPSRTVLDVNTFRYATSLSFSAAALFSSPSDAHRWQCTNERVACTEHCLGGSPGHSEPARALEPGAGECLVRQTAVAGRCGLHSEGRNQSTGNVAGGDIQPPGDRSGTRLGASYWHEHHACVPA